MIYLAVSLTWITVRQRRSRGAMHMRQHERRLHAGRRPPPGRGYLLAPAHHRPLDRLLIVQVRRVEAQGERRSLQAAET